MKLEIRDPALIKIIDHLKDEINNDPSYYTKFGIPEYLKATSKTSSHSGHFIEFYFGWLNVHFKTLSQDIPLTSFLKKWEFICKHLLREGNEIIMKPNGYQLKLKLELTAKVKRGKKYPVINVPLNDTPDSEKQLKSLGSFFYNLKLSSRGQSAYE